MTLAEVPSLLVDVGAAAGALTALVLFVGLVWRSRPARWLWRTLVAEPFSEWTRAQVTHVVEPMVAEVRQEVRPNGGSSFRDEVAQRLEEGDRRFDRLERKLDQVAQAVGAEGCDS